MTSTTSYGVLKAEAAAGYLTRNWRWSLFGFLAVAAYAVSLDQYTTYSYEVEALATTFGQHTLIATIGTIRSIFAAVAQPPFAKICDTVGRFPAYCASVFFYTLGYIIVASSPNIGAYAAGSCLYQVGLTGFWLVNQVLIADFTSTRSRVFWSISPSILGTINVWVSGNVAESVIEHSTWRWGYGMFAIIVPIVIAPVLFILGWTQRKARKSGLLDDIVAPWKHGNVGTVLTELFWHVDVVGLFLLVAAFTLILVPVTIYVEVDGGWSSARIIAPFTIGLVLALVFFAYEGFVAPNPIMPPHLFKRRSITFGFLIGLFLPMADGIAGNYLYTWYIVAADQTVLSATRLNGLPAFVEVLSVAVTGLLIVKLRVNKPFMIFGAAVEVLALGLMTRYRGPENSVAELAWMQILRGLGYGPLIWPTQAGLQAVVTHEQVAIVTAAFLALYYLAAGVGNAIGGAIWSSVLPTKLNAYLNDADLAASVFADPITFASENAVGTAARDAVIAAYSDAQRILLITAVSLASLVFVLACLVQNPKLTDTITLPSIEKGQSIEPGALTGRIERDAVTMGVQDKDRSEEGSTHEKGIEAV